MIRLTLLVAALAALTTVSAPAPTPTPVPAPTPVPTPVAAPLARCEDRIAALDLAAPSARHERYVAQLPEVVVHTRITHALYLRWPEASPARARLEQRRRPDRALRDVAARGDRARLRELALSDGYLFAETPTLARALSSTVDLPSLFDAPTIHRLRDGRVDRLTRVDGDYVEADGTRATLRLNDRVAEDAADLAAPLHLDLALVRARTAALRAVPTAVGADAAAFELRFPDGSRRPALVRLDDGATEVTCVGGDPETLEATLADAARFAARHARIVASARALVRERPRFDEPVNEPEGVQEDGALRPAWERAYARGERTFSYRDVEYPVYDRDGNARPPQVCVDFVFDSWERAEGAWFRPRGEEPGRADGPRFRGVPRRSIQQLLAHARDDDTLARHDVRPADRVALAEGPRFARAMARAADDVREGDALVIYGLRLQDGRNHYHAVLVLEAEPMTGVPMTVADNQGRPRLRTLASAMRAAPLRHIDHRIRVDFDRLEVASR